MSNEILTVEFCIFCSAIRFDGINREIKKNDIEELVDMAAIKFLLCNDCDSNMRVLSKKILKEAYEDGENERKSGIKGTFKIIK